MAKRANMTKKTSRSHKTAKRLTIKRAKITAKKK